MSRPKAKNRLTERERIELSRAIAGRIAVTGTYADIYRELKIRQPVVSLALHQRLVTRTATVRRLFEYLNIQADEPVDDIEPDASDGRPAVSHTTEERIPAEALEAVMRLSDGTPQQDGELIELLMAIRRFVAARRIAAGSSSNAARRA